MTSARISVAPPGEGVAGGSTPPTPAAASTGGHYVVLDGLRGVAAVMVVVFHIFEAHAGGDPHRQIVNHGYLAVDFFFLLSGFVIAHAYDGRWGRMGVWAFASRRLVRLQPMVVLGSLIGLLLFPFQEFAIYPKVASAPAWQVLLAAVLGAALLPLPTALDIRGWNEMSPLNGPAWSLFYEAGANALYALGLRRLSLRALGVLVALAAAALVQLAVFGGRGDLIGGWALDAGGARIGLTRVMFPFFAGVLLMRIGARVRLRNAFGLCSAALVIALALPRFGGTAHPWINGLYEAACVILLFPLIVAIGAGEKRAGGASLRIARFFGDLSYPLYITHFPLIYLYNGWVAEGRATGVAAGVAVLAASVVVAYACLRLYDEPVRRWLGGRLLARMGGR